MRYFSFLNLSSVLLCFALAGSPLAFAQSPEDIFRDDFVREGQGKKTSNLPSSSKKKSHRPLFSEKEKQEVSDVKDALSLGEDADIEDVLSAYWEKDGIPLASIGLVVNARDREHFTKHLSNLIHIAATFDLVVSQVAAVGYYVIGRENPSADGFAFSPQAIGLISVGGTIAPYNTLPKGFDIERSPTWVFNTSQGTILLEGYEKFWLYLNKKGNFVERSASELALVNSADNEPSVQDRDISSFPEVSTESSAPLPNPKNLFQ